MTPFGYLLIKTISLPIFPFLNYFHAHKYENACLKGAEVTSPARCSVIEKDKFWMDLGSHISTIPKNENLQLAADLKGMLTKFVAMCLIALAIMRMEPSIKKEKELVNLEEHMAL